MEAKKLKQLLHPTAITTAVIVALSWFIIMYLKHGTEYLSSFFDDQVGQRVSSKFLQVIKNTFLGIINLIAFTLPWILIAFSRPAKFKSFITGASSEMKAIIGFIALWVITVIAMSGAVFKFYDRYLLPVIPLAALFFSIIMIQTETKYKRPVRNLFQILNILLLTINVIYITFIFPDRILVAGTAAGTVLFILIQLMKNRIAVPGIAIANVIMLLWFNGHVLLYTLLMPNPGKQISEAIYQEQVTGNEKIYVYGNIRTASAIRIYSNHQLNVISMDTVYEIPAHPEHLLVFNKNEEHLLNLKDYKISKGSEEWKNVPADRFPGLLKPAINNLKNSGTIYYLAKPKVD